MSTPMMGWGLIRHARLSPSPHEFQYRSAFLYLPMRSMRANPNATALHINRPGWVSFFDQDHGDGRGPEQGGAVAWVDEILNQAGIDAPGELWLQTLPRVAGYTFKPVSFWYAYKDETLVAILAEVNNTFKERHVYLMTKPKWGVEMIGDKVFYVSPFNPVAGQYRFRFMKTSAPRERIVARVDYFIDGEPVLKTSWSGDLSLLDHKALRRLKLQHPLMTLGVIVRIHWHALLLYLKRVPLKIKPAPPETLVSIVHQDASP